MRYTLLFCLSLTMLACKPTPDTDEVDLGVNYFPHKVGASWEYRVDSLAYDDNSGATLIDTFVYQYKETIASSFTDVSGQEAQLVNRFYRAHDSLPWAQASNATVLVTNLTAQKVEENIRYAKLVFPVALNKVWNGNMYNALDEADFRITRFDEPQTIGGLTYGQTLTVLQKDELNAIEEIRREEVYARNTGLVSLSSDSINTQVSGSRGYRYRLTLKSYTP
jgi:hypothetical protein